MTTPYLFNYKPTSSLKSISIEEAKIFGKQAQDIVTISQFFTENIRSLTPEKQAQLIMSIKSSPAAMTILSQANISDMKELIQIILFCKSISNIFNELFYLKNHTLSIQGADNQTYKISTENTDFGHAFLLTNNDDSELGSLAIKSDFTVSYNIWSGKQADSGQMKIKKVSSFLKPFFQDEQLGMTKEELAQFNRIEILDASSIPCRHPGCGKRESLRILHIMRTGQTWYESLGAKAAPLWTRHPLAAQEIPKTIVAPLEQAPYFDVDRRILDFAVEALRLHRSEITLKDIATLFHQHRADILTDETTHNLYHLFCKTFTDKSRSFKSPEGKVYSTHLKNLALSYIVPPGGLKLRKPEDRKIPPRANL